MPELHGITGRLIPSPGARLSFDPNGIATLDQKYEITPRDSVFALAPGPFAPHPEYPILGNVIQEMTIELLEASAIVVCKYRGVIPSTQDFAFGEVASYRLIRGVASAPIDTHPEFVSNLGGTKANPKNRCIFDAQGKFKGFPPDAPNDLGGVTHYEIPKTTWQATRVFAAPLSDINNVGKIATPIGPAPSLPNGYNWKLSSISEDQEGAVHKATYNYEASETELGWNSLIYESAS